MIRSTSSRWTPSTSASSAASVTRAPGLRKIFASPGWSPTIRERVDPRVHAGHDRQARVRDSVEAAEGEVDAKSRLAASRSSKLPMSQRFIRRCGAPRPCPGRGSARAGTARERVRRRAPPPRPRR